MAEHQSSGPYGPDNPDLMVQLAGMLEVHARVVVEHEIEAIAIELRTPTRGRGHRRAGIASLLISLDNAVDLAARLVGSVERLRREQQAARGEYPAGDEG